MQGLGKFQGIWYESSNSIRSRLQMGFNSSNDEVWAELKTGAERSIHTLECKVIRFQSVGFVAD